MTPYTIPPGNSVVPVPESEWKEAPYPGIPKKNDNNSTDISFGLMSNDDGDNLFRDADPDTSVRLLREHMRQLAQS
ncbi:MAG: hypothetical protein DSY53_01745, partial [Persephonella sp.]